MSEALKQDRPFPERDPSAAETADGVAREEARSGGAHGSGGTAGVEGEGTPYSAAAGAREPVPLVAAPGSSRMRWAQGWAVCRTEVARQLVQRRALAAVALASLPVLMMGAFVLMSRLFGSMSVGDASRMFGQLFSGLSVAMALFFGTVAIFSTLIRREVRDRTLHYHFLAPVRREVVLLGKYAGGVLTAWLIFGLSTLLSYALVFLPFAWRSPVEVQAFFFDGPGFAHLGAYLAVTALASVGYGAVFLFMGMFFKNPVLPAMAVYFWEVGNFLLPPALKKVSVIHYLTALLPLPPNDGPLAMLSELPPVWLAVPGLLLVSAALVALAAWKARRMEILYGED